jgi:hypothetical protein
MIHPMIFSWAHLPSSTTSTLTYAFSTSAKVRVIWSHTFVLHLFQCFLALPAFHKSQYHVIPSDHISSGSMNDLVGHSPSIFNAPKFFCIHVNQAIPQNDIRLTTTLNDLLMNMCPAIFKSECFLPVSSYVFKSRYLPFAYKQQSRSSWSAM